MKGWSRPPHAGAPVDVALAALADLRVGDGDQGHRDPFDRLLVAQAPTEDLAIVSADDVFARNGVRRVW